MTLLQPNLESLSKKLKPNHPSSKPSSPPNLFVSTSHLTNVSIPLPSLNHHLFPLSLTMFPIRDVKMPQLATDGNSRGRHCVKGSQ